ncbi:hypothetical protein HYQ46_000989 [Verticillium longisporum]|nr:hypothetical protein HYQ46_000989 [Verticillium longisporum]
MLCRRPDSSTGSKKETGGGGFMEGENGKPPMLGVAEVMEGADDCVVPEEAVVELEFVRELTGLAGRVVRLGGNEEVLGFVTAGDGPIQGCEDIWLLAASLFQSLFCIRKGNGNAEPSG